MLTSSVGVVDNVVISGHAGALREEDIILMTTDGVYQFLTPGDVMETLATTNNVQEGVEKVLDKINTFENTDNATLVCLFVD